MKSYLLVEVILRTKINCLTVHQLFWILMLMFLTSLSQEPEQVADSLNDLDVDDDQDDLTDWDLNLEDVDEGLSVIDRQQLFRKSIAHWAVDTNVSRDSVNKLFAVFRTDPSLSFLPKNYKTLLGTPRKVNTVEVSPGRYFEFNFLDGITSFLDFLNASFESRDVILKIKIGCDGMPARKSTNSQFWPILGLIVMVGAKPFEIGFYHGHSKPDHLNDYLRHFHTEITNLIENGFHYKESNIRIEIAGFCCDAPALGFIKFVKSCRSYYCCMKCETEGEFVFNGSGRGMIKDDFELIDVWMLWQCYEEEIPETEKEMHQYIDGRQDQPSNAALRDAADEAENPLNRPKTRPEKKILKGLPRAVARTKCVRFFA
ncbi:uncharacterized protein LOC116932417 [Daphnia magna]|uniref:uncharacterized protein LOC116932417 n=1 Tax=Daphnia magna TaxID=35525 RepID=UPI001E1BC8A0|nr:uncharacterized protein LOC116932417 [Daphnia magna]